MSDKVEILAPAGSWESLVAAVENGSDAVYLGGVFFSARQYADNFNSEELRKAVEYCHHENVKVYVTVNTLIFFREFHDASDYLFFLYDIGVDGVIVQDIGLFWFLKRVLPKLFVHASTQTTIHDAYGANFLFNHGVSRVVLARELSLKNIEEISKQTQIELEVFVHGALCISFSGQCLFSSMIGGRSGNRGKCAQPCRLPYKLTEMNDNGSIKKEIVASGDYILSTKDLNTVFLIPDLVEAGCDSFKFEGRMKRPEYVATVIKTYRKALDRYYKNPDTFQVAKDEIDALEQVFNRGFTEAFLKEKSYQNLMSFNRPSNRGLFIGRISSISSGNKISIKLEKDLCVGDGIQTWISVGGRQGETVKKIWHNGKRVEKAKSGWTVELELSDKVRSGDRIFKTYDHELMKDVLKSQKKNFEAPKIELEMHIVGKVNKPLKIKVKDDKNNEITIYSSTNVQRAIKHPLTEDALERQLGRLGETNYFLGSLKVDLQKDIMFPFSELNNMRREIVSKLDDLQETRSVPNKITAEEFKRQKLDFMRSFINKPKEMHGRFKQSLSVKVGDYASFLSAVAAGADIVYIPLSPLKKREFTFKQLEAAIFAGKKKNIKVVPFLPRIILPDKLDPIEETFKKLSNKVLDGVMVGNLGQLLLVKERLPSVVIYGDYHLNIFNPFAAKFLFNEKMIKMALSPELNFEEIKEFPDNILINSECIIHGYIPLMISRYCPINAVYGSCYDKANKDLVCENKNFALKDRKNYLFPIEMDEQCLMQMYNAKILCMAENIKDFKKIGIGSLRLEMERESSIMVEKVTEAYMCILREKQIKSKFFIDAYPAGLTKGHYFRGVE